MYVNKVFPSMPSRTRQGVVSLPPPAPEDSMVVEVVTPGPEEVGTTLQPAHPTHITTLPDIDLQAIAASIPPPPEVNNLQIIL